MPLSEIVCHLWAGTGCDEHVYQIWSFYIHPLGRYKICTNWGDLDGYGFSRIIGDTTI